MKAVVCRNGVLSVREHAQPQPGARQVLLKVLRCGICGSDLHVRQHCDAWGTMMARGGYTSLIRAEQNVVVCDGLYRARRSGDSRKDFD